MKTKEIKIGEHYALCPEGKYDARKAYEVIVVAKRPTKETPSTYNDLDGREGTTIGIAMRRGVTDQWYPLWRRPQTIVGLWSEVSGVHEKALSRDHREKMELQDSYGRNAALEHHLRQTLKPDSDYSVTVKYSSVTLPTELLQQIMTRAGFVPNPNDKRVIVKHEKEIYEAIYQDCGGRKENLWLGKVYLRSLRPVAKQKVYCKLILTQHVGERECVIGFEVEDGEYRIVNGKSLTEYLV